MTRFSLTMDEALDFILESAYLGNGSEVFVPKIKSYSLTDLKETIKELLGNVGDKNISLRPGEKLHEVLINQDEVRYAWEYYDNYVIFTPEKDISESLPIVRLVWEQSPKYIPPEFGPQD